MAFLSCPLAAPGQREQGGSLRQNLSVRGLCGHLFRSTGLRCPSAGTTVDEAVPGGPVSLGPRVPGWGETCPWGTWAITRLGRRGVSQLILKRTETALHMIRLPLLSLETLVWEARWGHVPLFFRPSPRLLFYEISKLFSDCPKRSFDLALPLWVYGRGKGGIALESLTGDPGNLREREVRYQRQGQEPDLEEMVPRAASAWGRSCPQALFLDSGTYSFLGLWLQRPHLPWVTEAAAHSGRQRALVHEGGRRC